MLMYHPKDTLIGERAKRPRPSRTSLIRDCQIGMRVHPLKHCFNVLDVNSTGLLVSAGAD